MARSATCPNAAQHNSPSSEELGYVAWHEWAERQARTHTQHRCDGCGLWVIWKPKGDSIPIEEGGE